LRILDELYDWIILIDKNKKIVYVNKIVEEITGYKKEELIGKNYTFFLSQNINIYIPWHEIKKRDFEEVFPIKTKKGKERYVLSKIVSIDDHFVFIGKDITREIKYRNKINHFQLRDDLTGFWNKNGFLKKIKEVIKKYPDEVHLLALLDIYDFNKINHKYGLEKGDEILKEVARRLRVNFSDHKLIMSYKNSKVIFGRFNGDEFGIFVYNVNKDCHKDISDKINSVFREAFKIDNDVFHLSYNLGFAYYPYDAKNEKELYNMASIALNNAKKIGANCYRFYSKEYTQKIHFHTESLKLIEEALRNDEFKLFFQPYVDSKDETIVGFESLLRIVKENEVISPFYFIEALEESAFIVDVDLKVLDYLEEFLVKHDKNVSFNLSERSFRSEKVLNKIISIAKKYPNRLVIELVERLFIDDIGYSKSILNEFKRNNILIAMDDFGTGYSSLSYLKEFDLDIIKLDLSFIKNMLNSKTDFHIIETIISLSKKLNIKSLAEGVESIEQAILLKRLEIDYLQGFLYYKPMPFEKALKVLNESRNY
jgi:diguanylate cyclase (GGDEF)-like protein/PAS domain S-box-containing protein